MGSSQSSPGSGIGNRVRDGFRFSHSHKEGRAPCNIVTQDDSAPHDLPPQPSKTIRHRRAFSPGVSYTTSLPHALSDPITALRKQLDYRRNVTAHHERLQQTCRSQTNVARTSVLQFSPTVSTHLLIYLVSCLWRAQSEHVVAAAHPRSHAVHHAVALSCPYICHICIHDSGRFGV